MIRRSASILETLARLRRLKIEAGRLGARVQFALRGGKRQTPLSEAQLQQYQRDGYLLVSGLIPDDVAREAEAAMLQSLGADQRFPETWSKLGPRPHQLKDGRLIATYTEAMMAAAAQLAGEDVAAFRRPTHAFTANRPPVSAEWKPTGPHLDRTVVEWRCRTFPRPYWIGAVTYLTDVPPHGGGTVVWPGSHLKLEALARGEPVKYKYLAALTAELGRFLPDPSLELTPRRGDVMFHHYLLLHSSSENVSGTPRLAILHKW
jgi:hypothetical protein